MIVMAIEGQRPRPAASTGPTELLGTETRTGHRIGALVAAWLGSFSESAATRDAYGRDVHEYLSWCLRRELDPLSVRLPEVQMYATELASAEHPRTGRVLAANTRARKLAAVSSWYTFLVRAGTLEANPARDVARPRYDRGHSPTASVSQQQARGMLAASTRYAHRTLDEHATAVIMRLLVDLGVRVSELCQAAVGDLGSREGMRVLTVRMKGGTTRTRPLPPAAAAAIDRHLATRSGVGDRDPLVTTRAATRLTRHQVYRLVQRMAQQAGVPAPERITPHAMRHTFNTLAREGGAALEDRRDALGHSSAAITQLYDHVALSLHQDPAHLVAAATGTDESDHDSSEQRPEGSSSR
ncbi:hypothetical protein GCM10027174_27030 [Salinifilum aidingensis]